MAFEKGKTIKELEIDTSRKFRVVSGNWFEKGDILEFVNNDNYNKLMALFKRLSDGKELYVDLGFLEYAEEEPKFKVGDSVKFGSEKGYFVCHKNIQKESFGYIIEKINGWPRDRDIPKSYKSRLGNEYWWVDVEELKLIEKVEEKVAILVPTQEEYDAIVQHYINKGDINFYPNNWGVWKEITCLSISYVEGDGTLGFSRKSFYEEKGYTIKPASYVLGEKNTADSDINPYYYPPLPMSIAVPEALEEVANEMFNAVASTTNELFNKLKRNFMSKIVEFAKNLKLAPKDKKLRKYGLQDECGDYTPAYEDIVDAKVYEDHEEYVLKEVVAKLEAEEKEAKKK